MNQHRNPLRSSITWKLVDPESLSGSGVAGCQAFAGWAMGGDPAQPGATGPPCSQAAAPYGRTCEVLLSLSEVRKPR